MQEIANSFKENVQKILVFSGVNKFAGSAYGALDTMESILFPNPTQLNFCFGGVPLYFGQLGLIGVVKLLKKVATKIKSSAP